MGMRRIYSNPDPHGEVLEKKMFKKKKFSVYYYLPLEKGYNLNPLYLRMICAKSIKNWPCGSGEEDV
jgi:hypothetical protein